MKRTKFKTWYRSTLGNPIVGVDRAVFYKGDLSRSRKKHLKGLLEALESCVDWDRDDLNYGLNWKKTPQGHSYWYDRYAREVPISQEDVDYLRSLLEGNYISS